MSKSIDKSGFISSKKLELLAQRLKQKGIDTLKTPMIPRRRVESPCPLSFAQQRLWLLHQLNPEDVAYLFPMTVRLGGTLDAGVLKHSLEELVQRHEVLRTTFPMQADQPVQVIHPASLFHLPLIDLQGLAQEERIDEAQQLTSQEAQRPCDLIHGPLLRTYLLRLNDEDHILLLTMHHIITDGWSNEIFVRELTTLYQAFIAGKPSPLPPLPIQYADFSIWQRQWLQGEVLETQLAYWRRQLADVAPLELPTDYPYPPVQTFRGAYQSVRLPATLRKQLISLSQQEGVTLFMLLLATFQVLLARYTDQRDICVGSPIANRTRPELEGLIGFFVNTLVLRTDLSGNPSFVELLKRVREVTLGAYAHQDVPFEKLVEVLQPERDLSRPPLFQVMFGVQQTSTAPGRPEDMASSRPGGEQDTTKFELLMYITETEQNLLCKVAYNTDLFEAETISSMLEHWQTLVEGIVATPHARLTDLPILSTVRRHRLLIDWNATQTAIPCDQPLHTLVETQVSHTPDAIALVFEGFYLSYAALNRYANQLATCLLAMGIRPSVAVALCMERSIEGAIAVLGILKAGGIYIPLDPATPHERLTWMLAEARAPVLITHLRLSDRLPQLSTHLLCLDQLWTQLTQQQELPMPHSTSMQELAYVMYTSGSTGRPKGVMVPQRAIVNRLWWGIADVGLQAADRAMQLASWSFDISLWELFGPWMVGAAVVVVAPHEVRESTRLLERVREEQITVLHVVPSLLEVLVQEASFGECQSVRCLLCGGEAVSAELVRRVFASLPVPLHQYYGPTEAAISVTSWTGNPEQGCQKLSIGRPIANTQIYVMDQNWRPVGQGMRGELWIGGQGLAWGYLQQPDLTAERFVPDALSGEWGGRVYRTGDVAHHLPDGALRFVGRNDTQVKLRGYRIEPGEIEAVLLESPAVQQAVVLARENNRHEKYLAAYLVLRQGPSEVSANHFSPLEKATIPSLPSNKTSLSCPPEIELWPSIGEYFVYDELIYYGLTGDEPRNNLYKAAFEQVVVDKVVVDIGTGRDAILARLCIEAGAKHVYAIELLEESARHALACINRLGLADRITIIHGDATQVHLPERAEVCVSEIFEAIGGAEGAAVILNSAQRLLVPAATIVPARSLTKIAAVSLPPGLRAHPSFTAVSGHYVQKIFEQVGYPFDLRLCIKNFPLSHLISTAEIFEDLDCNGHAELEFSREVQLTITQHTRIDGFLLWLVLELVPGQILDILEGQYSWFPVYFPVFSPGVEVAPGDVIEVICRGMLSKNGVNPDYAIEGRLLCQNREPVPFTYISPHHQQYYKQTHFYQQLFADDAIPVANRQDSEQLKAEVQHYLKQRLPEYMVPAFFISMAELPLTPSGKIDRRALPDPQTSSSRFHSAMTAPRTPIEELLEEIWREILGRSQVGIFDNFFDLGGHSLLATRLVSRVRTVLQVELPLRSLFEAPTIAELARRLEQILRGGQSIEVPPLVPMARTADLPLSFAQQRLWLLDQLNPGSTAYLIPSAFQLQGALNVEALEDSIEAVIRRHESLRTTFQMRAGQLVQIVHPTGASRLPLVDLRNLGWEEREQEARRLAGQEAQQPADLAQGPLMRIYLLHLASQEHVLLLTLHHILTDGWSNELFARELSTFYRAFAAGVPCRLPPLPIQYADFALWQRQWLQGQALERQLAYWKHQLAEAPVLELPIDFHRPPRQTFRGAHQASHLPPALREALLVLSQREGVTLFMLLLAAFQVLLSRYSGQKDISIGTAIANRTHAELEGLIGFFVNTLVLRTNLRGARSFVEILKRVREVALGAYAHQDVPFEQLVEVLQPQRDLSRAPLFQVIFGVRQLPETTEQLDGVTLSRLSSENITTQFDLMFTVTSSARGLHCDIIYNIDLFEASTIQRLLEHWQILLHAIMAAPHLHLAELPLLSDDERYRLLIQWNATAHLSPQHADLLTLFAQQVARTPDALAVHSEETSLSYACLDRCSSQLAHYLHTLGIVPEMLVGVLVERSPAWLLCLLAILKAGGGYVPLEPGYPPLRLQTMLADAEISFVLSGHEQSSVTLSPHISSVCLTQVWNQVAQQPPLAPVSQRHIDQVAYVIFTSGSTGIPKGVLVSHRGLGNLAQAQAAAFAVSRDSRVLQWASPSFDASLAEIVVSWLAGACLVLAAPQRLLPGADLLKLLEEQAITVLTLPPSALAVLPQAPLPALATLIVAGEACPSELLERWGPGRRCCNAYGPTETTVCASVAIWQPQADKRHGASIGRPLANTQCYIVDEEGALVPQGVVGELCVAGVGLARGYLGQGDMTAERFVPHPWSEQPGQRLYKTGDRVRYRGEGMLEWVGRRDQQVKVRGYRIELAEIETILAAHEAIRQCVVVVRQEEEVSNVQVVAYVVSERGPRLSSELRSYLQERLPDYMLPSRVVVLDALPLLSNGKVNRQALLSQEADAPEPDVAASAVAYTPIEELLVKIWCEVLGDEQVGIHDDFFTLGGHSLLATQIISRVRTVLQVDLPVQTLFESSTIAELAQRVEQVLRGGEQRPSPPLIAVARGQELPLSLVQERLWFLEQLEPGSIAYLMPAAYQLNGPLNTLALEISIGDLVQRHERVRTTFAEHAGHPVQFVHSAGMFRFPLVDLAELSEAESGDETRRLARQEAQYPFDLTKGPLLRVFLLRLDRQEHVLLLTMHHIICDGWSSDVIVQELLLLYRAFAAGEPSPLVPLSIQYADFAAWQRQWLQGDVLETQLVYWQRQLTGVPPLELPTDHPRPPLQTYKGASLSVCLPATLRQGLMALSQQEDVTLFMLLLAAFQVLLARYTGQTDISVGTIIDNRTRAELEGLVGSFMNTLVLRTNLSGNPTFVELLRRVRKEALEAYTHQDVPFEHLVEALQPERDLSRSPLFQVMFNVAQQIPMNVEGLGGLSCSNLDIGHCTTRFDLSLSVSDNISGLHCIAVYATDLFEASTMSRLLEHWQTILEGIVRLPQASLSELSIVTSRERQLILRSWNDRRVAVPTGLRIQDLFEVQVERKPEGIAVVYEDQQLTYGLLNLRANQLAHYLQELGIGPEVLVGIYMERSVDLLVGLLSILKAGGAYVPLDPSYPEERLAFILNDAQAVVLLTQQRLVDTLPTHHSQVICLDSDWTLIGRQESRYRDVRANHLAYMLYTSGSTGMPKGVMVPHANLVNAYYAWESAYHLQSDCAVHLQMANFSFDVFTGDMIRALCSGGKLVLCPRELLLEAKQLYALMKQEQVDCAEFVPVVLRNLLTYLQESAQSLDFMRVLAVGSDSWYSREHQEAGLLCGQQTRLINSYGVTEATVDSSYFEGTLPEGAVEGIVPIGRPFANIELYLLDTHLHPVPIGCVGELHVGGMGLARGYRNRPELTAEKFIPHPWSEVPGARLYKTGDLAQYQPDGTILYIGRLDNQVKIRGYRIELGEIEAVLAEHPWVREGVVLANEDNLGDKCLVAYVVGSQSQFQPSDHELRRYLQQRLPDYMLPTCFVFLKSLPLTSNGKVDRRALPVPDMRPGERDDEQLAPRTPVEELLTEIWCEVLLRSQLGVHDNFFALGGHSLLATRLISQVRTMLQADVPLRSLFENPTIAGLALRVEQVLRDKQLIEAPPLIPVPRTHDLPLSFAQQRLWFFDQLEPESIAYLMPSSLRLQGTLDTVALERSLEEVVRRHESLRTTFHERAGQPVQVIHPAGILRLPLVDLRELEPQERTREARRLAGQEVQHPFDLAQGPLLRVSLLCLDRQEHVLLVTMHHIISDGWSDIVFMREMTTLYQAFVAGQSSPLPPLPIQYADFAVWQRQWLQGKILEAQLVYWRHQLADIPQLELPIDHPRPSVQTYRGAHLGVYLPEALHEELIALSQREGVTLFMLLLAAFQVLLARYTGQNDISIGTLIANRTRTELEGLIGYFVNTLVLRTDLSGNPSFVEVLRRVREVALGAYAHQDVPFEQLVEMLQPQRDLSRSPLFQVMFSLRQIAAQASTPLEAERQHPKELSMNGLGVEHPKAVFDLTFAAVSSAQGLNCQVEYNTDLFEVGTIRRLLEHWRTLLGAVVAAPHTPMTRLPLLSEVERQHVLVDWNATHSSIPTDLPLHILFTQQVTRTPDAVAVVCGETLLTYSALNRRANQLAHYLRAQGVGPDVLVGIYMERSTEMLVTILAIFKAGGAYLPLDPAYPAQHLTYVLQDAQVQVVVTQAPWAASVPISIPSLICLEQSWHVIAGYDKEPPLLFHHEHQLAYTIYTSGSTGRPKGAMVTQRGMLNHLLAKIETLHLSACERVAQTASHCFDISVWQFLSVLLQGGQVHILVDQVSHDPAALFKQVAAEYISILEVVPSLLRAWLNSIELGQRVVERASTKSLRWLIVTGEAFPVDVSRLWAHHYPHVFQLNAYGPTECSDDVTHAVVTPDLLHRRTSVPIGQPIANTQIYILDSYFEPVPVGVPGQIYVGGSGVGRGYLRNAERTATAFVPDPFGHRTGARLYKTGDVGRYLEDGSIEFRGRIDQQVKVRGYRIEPGEIEAVLQEHPSIRESVVLAHEDARGSKFLVAYVVCNESATGTFSGELRRYLQEKLPEYMVPASLVTLPSLPLTPNGKVDREALPAPEVNPIRSDSVVSATRTPIEEIIAAIWCEVLHCSQVDLHDNFFELGGHSLLATQLISRVRAVLQVEIPLRSLFSAPTIAGLAQRVEQVLRGGQSIEVPLLLQVARPEHLPLSFAQQRLWFLDQLEPGSTAYLIPGARSFYGDIDTLALEQSLTALVQRHEILRTTFQVWAGQPTQVIHPAEVFRLPLVDLRGLKHAEGVYEAQQLARQEAQHPCDLVQGPLLRTCLLRLAVEEHVLLVTMHHIISDGWSNDVFMRELMTLYRAFASKQPSPLPPLPIQYADFAIWQRNWLHGEVLQRHLDYWKRQLEGATPLDLPTDHLRPKVQSYRGADYSFALPTDLSRHLVALSKQENTTLFMTLLAAFQTLLYRYTGQTDILVGTDVANRTHIETETLIGFFINLLALRIDLRGSPIFRNVLHRVREMVLGAYMHQDIPFEMLVEHLRLERRTNQIPLVQVLFVLQNTPRPTEKLPGMLFEAANKGVTTSKFDLALFIQEASHGIGGVVTYSTDLFEERTIATLMSRFEVLLRNIVAHPTTSVDMLDIYTDAEKADQIKEKQGRRKLSARNLKAAKGKEIDLA